MKKIFSLFFKPMGLIKHIGEKIKNNIQRSIRIQLFTTFILCALGSFLVSRAVLPLFENINEGAIVDYSYSMRMMYFQAQDTAEWAIRENSVDILRQSIDQENEKIESHQNTLKMIVTDEVGEVLYKTMQVKEEHIDLHEEIRHVMNFTINQPFEEEFPNMVTSREEFTTLVPLTLQDKKYYFIVSGLPQGEVITSTSEGPIPFFIGVTLFILSFFYITKRKMTQIESLAEGVMEIAKGNLAYRIEKKGQDEIALLTDNINQMAEEIMTSIEMERKIEQQKNELITNVSHDLRTPLTSIMGYLRLLREEKYETKEQYDEYLKIAFSKSEQLKNLIDDLFEYTKLTNDKNNLVRQQVCLNELLDQLMEELVPLAEQKQRLFSKYFPDHRIFVALDSEKIVRVFDNLLINAINYSVGDGKIMVSLEGQDDHVRICVANQSDAFTAEELASLFERFYKKDQSRTNVTEGSGLGLAIAKSIVELHGGTIHAKYKNETLYFIITLPFTA
ncbi:cell wall metabolism sensor histidine kinase WalK [Lysinibacillus sp. ZYM-1]|uniref:sensor histidine kinase n=1 Tax=Lysinibacillus sp. ZYM-1 TaxID=1681184 RepID=UPI0006CE7821|nr:HAMP domain-containing sensor histidine kinase [Lysinibacillus sp. ZYM-1]KPN95170.1 histidine kinase [Lysinibacillus sp. ZYM-1]